MNGVLQISETAKRLGVSAHYLRVLERDGRIPPARRSSFGGRIYTPSDIAMLRSMGVGARPRRLRRPEDMLEAAR